MSTSTELNIIEGNKAIAEFVLVKVPERHYLEMNRDLQYYADSIDEFGTVTGLVSENNLKYHSSWDWQVPVWSKLSCEAKELITKLSHPELNGIGYFRFQRLYENAVHENKPLDGQKIIVELLNWYNQNKNI